MIETSIILSILLVGGMFLAARLAKHNARRNPAVEKARLRESLAWHEARLARAQAHNWDEQMVAGIKTQLAEVRERLAEIAAAEGPENPRNSAA
jgi:uncharacterized protein YneF (UPF0154 family)